MSEAGRAGGAIGVAPDPTAGFGLATTCFVVVSSMVGVGVLTTSGLIVARVGSNALMLGLWAVGGIIALCGALSLAELSAMLPRSGGEYVFLREAYGARMAFLAGWASLLMGFAAPVAAASWTAAAYLLAPLLLDGPADRRARLALATAAVVGFAAVHCRARRRTARVQGLVTGLELALLGGFIAAGLIAGRSGWPGLADLPTAWDGPLVLDLLVSMLYVSYGYTGWNAAAYLAGEVGDAPRRLPRAIVIGCLGVTALYLGLNLVYALALPAGAIRAIVRDEGERAIEPIAARAAQALFGAGWSGPFSAAVGLVLLATTSAFLLTGPRVMVAMARAGQFPAVAARLSARHGTPAVATTILAGLALALLWTGSFESIVTYAGVGLALSSMLAVASVYVLRAARPDLPRPFRVPLYPAVPGVYLAGTAAVVAAAFVREPVVSSLSSASLLAALPAYEVMRRRRGAGGLAGVEGGDTLTGRAVAASPSDVPPPTDRPEPSEMAPAMDPTPDRFDPDRAPVDLPPVEPPTAGFILQLFVIPAIIVGVVVVVWLLFGKLAGGERDAMSYVETMKSPGANWRAAFELVSLIQNDPKVARDPKLLGELAALLDQDLDLKADQKLLEYLALTLGAFQTLDAVTESGRKVDPVGVLVKAMEDNRPAELRIAAAASLAKQGARLDGTLDDPRAIKALAATRSSEAVELRKIAAYALGFLGGPEAASGLRVMLDDEDRDVRYNAAVGLGRRGDIAALGNYREMLSDKDLALLFKSLPDAERPTHVEAIQLEALNALGSSLSAGHPELPGALRGEIDMLSRSGLVSVRTRSKELLKSLPENR